VSERARQAAHDALLTWCSEAGSGTVAQLQAACRALGLRALDAMWALSLLGHVEIDRAAGRWAAAPTVLTTLPELAGRMLVCGARPYGLLERLAAAGREHGVDVDVHQEGRHQFGDAPEAVIIDGDPADGPALAAAAGVRFEPRAHHRIARSLPAVSLDAGAAVRGRPDDRFPCAPVDPVTFRVRWDLADRPSTAGGLWHQRTWGGRPQAWLGARDELWLLARLEYGPYIMDRDDDEDPDPIVEYRAAHRVLVVDCAAPLPPLHARAAALCSGRIPLRRHAAPGIAHDHFLNVDPSTAQRITTTLGADQ
jgi:hypothetical protein